jgi:hypothetical protein
LLSKLPKSWAAAAVVDLILQAQVAKMHRALMMQSTLRQQR